jgi:hypothetical protein
MEEKDATLVQVIERLQRWLVPVEPPPAFVRSLRLELTEAARRQHQRARRMRHLWLVGAAIAGSVASIVGVTALLLLRRSARAHPPVTVG